MPNGPTYRTQTGSGNLQKWISKNCGYRQRFWDWQLELCAWQPMFDWPSLIKLWNGTSYSGSVFSMLSRHYHMQNHPVAGCWQHLHQRCPVVEKQFLLKHQGYHLMAEQQPDMLVPRWYLPKIIHFNPVKPKFLSRSRTRARKIEAVTKRKYRIKSNLGNELRELGNLPEESPSSTGATWRAVRVARKLRTIPPSMPLSTDIATMRICRKNN